MTAFAQLVAAVRSDDRTRIEQALIGLGGVAPEGEDAWRITRTLLRDFFAPLLAAGERAIETSSLRRDMREIVRDKRLLGKLALPGKPLFLFRLRFGLYAVLARLGAIADWSTLEAHWAEEALGATDGRAAVSP